jgi:CRP/FNR family cyclic AMP-dependent transcriptional regulator
VRPATYMINNEPCIFQQRCPSEAVLVSAGKGRTIFAPGQRADYLFHLHEGVVAIITTNPQGYERTSMLIVPPQFIGIAGMSDMYGSTHRFHMGEARAITPVTYCKTRKEVIRDLIDNPEVRSQVFNSICSSMLDMANLTTSPLVEAIPKRIRYILNMLARSIGQTCQSGLTVIKGLSHEDIATIANTSRSTVTRVLKEMEMAGIITIHNRQIAFYAEFAPLYSKIPLNHKPEAYAL